MAAEVDDAGRSLHLDEFLNTEEAFVQTLKTLQEMVVVPLASDKRVMQEVDSIFGNFKILLGKHMVFLLRFRDALQNPSVNISEVFSQHFRSLRYYFPQIINFSDEIEENFDVLRTRVEISSNVNRAFTQAMIAPMQMATRYILLMKDVIKSSRKCNARDLIHLQSSETLLSESVEILNESKRKFEYGLRIKDIELSMTLLDLQLPFKVGKLSVKEGYVMTTFKDFIFALKGTTLYRYRDDNAFNENQFDFEFSCVDADIRPKVEARGGKPHCKIRITSPRSGKLILYTSDEQVMNGWVQSFEQSKTMKEEKLASDYRVLLREEDMMFMKKTDKAQFVQVRGFLFNDCFIVAPSDMAPSSFHNANLQKEKSFLSMRRRATNRGHRDTLGGSEVRRRTTIFDITSTQSLRVENENDIFQPQTLFFHGMEIEQDKFNAENLIHLKYRVADSSCEKGYVITFRDGTLEEREKKWTEWYGFLEDARTKFQEMVDLYSLPERIQQYYERIRHESRAYTSHILSSQFGRIMEATTLPDTTIRTLRQLSQILDNATSQLTNVQIKNAEEDVKAQVDEILKLEQENETLKNSSSEQKQPVDKNENIMEYYEELDVKLENLTELRAELQYLEERSTEIGYLGGQIFQLVTS